MLLVRPTKAGAIAAAQRFVTRAVICSASITKAFGAGRYGGAAAAEEDVVETVRTPGEIQNGRVVGHKLAIPHIQRQPGRRAIPWSA